MDIPDLEKIINEKDAIEEDYKIISSILKNVYEYYNKEDFKEIIVNFYYVKNFSHLFKWLYSNEENKGN